MSSEVDELEAIEKRRAERRDETAKKRKAQLVVDMTALDELEEEHGFEGVARLNTDRFVDGLPTMVVVRAPKGVEYKRFTQQVRNAQGKHTKMGEAQDALAELVWLYPSDDELKKQMKEAFPGLLSSVAVAAVGLADLKEQEEGKG